MNRPCVIGWEGQMSSRRKADSSSSSSSHPIHPLQTLSGCVLPDCVGEEGIPSLSQWGLLGLWPPQEAIAALVFLINSPHEKLLPLQFSRESFFNFANSVFCFWGRDPSVVFAGCKMENVQFYFLVKCGSGLIGAVCQLYCVNVSEIFRHKSENSSKSCVSHAVFVFNQ